MRRMNWRGAGGYWLVAVAACLLWAVCGPLAAAPVDAASAPAGPASGAPGAHMPQGAPASGPPEAGASTAAPPVPDMAERLRRCHAHPVRAVRDECLRQLRREAGPR